jgi:predicted dehydrogenase
MQKPSPKFGVVGVGFIGRIHLRALQEAGLEVVAIADPSEAARKEAAALVPGARQYADWKDLLTDPGVDAVNICTINALHFPILKAVVESGKHAFCEKTMTVNAAEASEALALKCAPGQVVQIGYMKRFFPAAQWAKEQLAKIGEPICASVRSFQGGLVDDGIFDSADWRPTAEGPSRTRRFASGGMLNMAGSHMLDMTAWLLGLPVNVTCRTWSPAGYDAELHAHGLFEMASGALVHFEAALPPFSKTGAYGNGWEELIQIDGRKGRLELRFPLWDRPQDFPAKAGLYLEETKTWEEPEFPAVNTFRLEMEAFAEACRSGCPVGPTMRDGAVVDCWIDACYGSASSGTVRTFSLG